MNVNLSSVVDLMRVCRVRYTLLEREIAERKEELDSFVKLALTLRDTEAHTQILLRDIAVAFPDHPGLKEAMEELGIPSVDEVPF
jgi:hypothetical protein